MKELLLGIDVGTTSIKASLYTPDHRQVVSGCENYSLETPREGYVEFPAKRYWDIVCGLTRKVAETAVEAGHIVSALALSCQGETLICLDKAGVPLRPAIVWLDNRAEKEAAALKAAFTVKRVYEASGQADMIATWPAAKILWLRNNQPELFSRTDKFLLLADYLVYRMTGRYVGDMNLWASSAMLNIHTGTWWPDMLDQLGVTPKVLPAIYPCGTRIGHLTLDAAAAMGLMPDCAVVTGALDQTCNMIGCGVTRPGSVMETTGSCLAVGALLDRFIPFKEGVPLTCQSTAIPGQYTILLWSQSAGMTLKWFAEKFYPECGGPENAYPLIDREAAEVPPGCGGLVMLPHLTGAANPEYDSRATGVFAGITLAHGRAHFARAVMESVACMLRRNLDQLSSFGIDSSRVFCAGGGASSRLWLQIKADLTARQMLPMTARDSACHGAAILAGVGIGLYKSIHWHEPAQNAALLPNAAQQAVYEATYRRYIALYEALRPYFAGTPRA